MKPQNIKSKANFKLLLNTLVYNTKITLLQKYLSMQITFSVQTKTSFFFFLFFFKSDSVTVSINLAILSTEWHFLASNQHICRDHKKYCKNLWTSILTANFSHFSLYFDFHGFKAGFIDIFICFFIACVHCIYI